jgi:AcrR family transcriptional regulator
MEIVVSLSADSRMKAGYHHPDLHNALQDEALRLISERNGPAFSLRELAEALGVSHTAVYRHFASKAALFEALTERGFAMLHHYQRIEIEKAGSAPLDRLGALSTAYIGFARENPGAFWLMFGNRDEEADCAKSRPNIHSEALQELIDAIEFCQRENIVIPGDPYRIACYLVMAPHGIACYSARDLEIIGISEQDMTIKMLTEIALIPVMVDPPSPREIGLRYFGAGDVSAG